MRINNILVPTYFDRSLRKAVDFVQEHAREYSALSTLEQISATTGTTLQPLKDVDDRHKKWFIDEFEQFARHKALESAILASTDKLERGEFGSRKNDQRCSANWICKAHGN